MTDPLTLHPGDADAIPTWRAAYSDRTASLMARLAGIAYFDVPALADRVGVAGFTLAAAYDDGLTQGFLARSEDFAALVFRGTSSQADWRTNLRAQLAPVQTPGGRTVRLHAGFLDAFAGLEQTLRADLDAHVGDKLGLYIAGHSLGGALAQIAAAMLERDTLAACYTFGAPRVGDQRFDEVVKCPHYRIVNGWDLVTTLPPPFPSAFRHSGDPRLLTGEERMPLRRDRAWPTRAAQNIAGIGLAIVGRNVLLEDHGIGHYVRRLSWAAGTRGPGAKA
jgi:triacylglycerol lipase